MKDAENSLYVIWERVVQPLHCINVKICVCARTNSLAEQALIGSVSMALGLCTYVMYLCPLLDMTGKQPVYLVATLPVISMHLNATRFFWICGSSEGDTFVVTVYSGAGMNSVVLVLRTCWWDIFKWPLAEGIDLGRFLLITLEVKPGHVVKKYC